MPKTVSAVSLEGQRERLTKQYIDHGHISRDEFRNRIAALDAAIVAAKAEEEAEFVANLHIYPAPEGSGLRKAQDEWTEQMLASNAPRSTTGLAVTVADVVFKWLHENNYRVEKAEPEQPNFLTWDEEAA